LLRNSPEWHEIQYAKNELRDARAEQRELCERVAAQNLPHSEQRREEAPVVFRVTRAQTWLYYAKADYRSMCDQMDHDAQLCHVRAQMPQLWM